MSETTDVASIIALAGVVVALLAFFFKLNEKAEKSGRELGALQQWRSSVDEKLENAEPLLHYARLLQTVLGDGQTIAAMVTFAQQYPNRAEPAATEPHAPGPDELKSRRTAVPPRRRRS